MILNRIILSIATALTLLSCSNETTEGGSITTEKVEVVISAAQASTRTAIEDDLTTTRWCEGDEIALWATGADDGVARFSGERFYLRYFGLSFSEAEFSSSIAPMDESQEYLYKAFYPYPSTVSGTNITYTLASSQSGEFDGINDFRVANEVTGKALTDSTIGGCNLSFRSLTHALRLTIPEGESELDYKDDPNEKVGITGLTVTLPYDAVGTLSLDMADITESSTTLASMTSNQGRTITLDLSSNPIYSGDERYLWVFINPVTGVTGDITIAATGANSAVTRDYTISISNHTFSAGCITPINTHIEEEIPYTINFYEGANNLGQTATSMTISTSDGSAITDDGSSSITMTNSSGNFSFEYTARTNPNLATKSLTVAYESADASVTGSNITIGTLVAGNSMDVSYDLPYLYEEDFSSISETGNTETTKKTVPGTSWYSGERGAWWENKRVSIRSYSSLGGPYPSRMYSPVLTSCNLKSGSTVKLRIIFQADWDKNESSSMNLIVYRTTSTSANEGNYDGKTIGLSDSDASSTSALTDREVEISSCASTNRIQWETDGENGSWANYDHIYIDNVKFQIVE